MWFLSDKIETSKFSTIKSDKKIWSGDFFENINSLNSLEDVDSRRYQIFCPTPTRSEVIAPGSALTFFLYFPVYHWAVEL